MDRVRLIDSRRKDMNPFCLDYDISKMEMEINKLEKRIQICSNYNILEKQKMQMKINKFEERIQRLKQIQRFM